MSKGTILVADDDKAIRTVLSKALARVGYEVRLVATAAALWQAIQDGEGDVLVTDVMMPDQNTFDLIPSIKRTRPDLPIIVISAKNNLATAVKTAELETFDYLPKPFDLDALIKLVGRAMDAGNAPVPRPDDAESDDSLPLVGSSPAMQEIYRMVARLTQNDLSVLIVGESGTGKELVARALHDFGRRKKAPFVALNMAAIPRELIESELFGYEKGAFTGATQQRSGCFAEAENGTLFLDEIGDMPTDIQTRLLRVLQEGEYMRVGGRVPITTNVRIIAATHHDLRGLIREGVFREDLYFRLNVVPLRLPPLRERLEDIELLVNHFSKQAVEQGLAQKIFDSSALARLRQHQWAGNVRELENLVRRTAALYSEDIITADIVSAELPSRQDDSDPPAPPLTHNLRVNVRRYLVDYFLQHGESLPEQKIYHRVMEDVEITLLECALAATDGHQLKTAALLGINRNTLRKKIKQYNINTQYPTRIFE